MGTNYYTIRNYHSGSEEKLHIGKSSAGWCFLMHVIPEKGLMGFWEWMEYIVKEKLTVQDEYGQKVAVSDLVCIVTKRGRNISWDKFSEHLSQDVFYTGRCAENESTEDYFHRINYSERGPNNLLRHRIDGKFCVGHGEGTWDYIAGDFC